MTKKVELFKYKGIEIPRVCMCCAYLEESLPSELGYRCHAGSCPAIHLSKDDREYVVKNWKCTDAIYEKTLDEKMDDIIQKGSEDIAKDIDDDILRSP